jgi:hypothetical protein
MNRYAVIHNNTIAGSYAQYSYACDDAEKLARKTPDDTVYVVELRAEFRVGVVKKETPPAVSIRMDTPSIRMDAPLPWAPK